MGIGRVFGAALGHGGDSYPFHVETLLAVSHNGSIELRWNDPCDNEWMGTKIVRKLGGYPTSMTDGTLIVNCMVRSQYAETGYMDTGLDKTTIYYYMAFPYSTLGVNCSVMNRFPAMTPVTYVLAYTGTKLESTITYKGKPHRRITLTTSGVLTITGDVVADLCLVGGGSNGKSSFGGAGGYLKNYLNRSLTTGAVTIGAGNGGQTKYGTLTANGVVSSQNGQTGGGSRATATPGTGSGTSTVPFGDTTNYSAHSAGGGAGGHADYVDGLDQYGYPGGIGGTNGSNGSSGGAWGLNKSSSGGIGGVKGGGKGGNGGGSSDDGANATYYGSGGGGYGSYTGSTDYTSSGSVGSGYQGVMYILVDTTAYQAM